VLFEARTETDGLVAGIRIAESFALYADLARSTDDLQ
jgi:hypothetical protein